MTATPRRIDRSGTVAQLWPTLSSRIITDCQRGTGRADWLQRNQVEGYRCRPGSMPATFRFLTRHRPRLGRTNINPLPVLWLHCRHAGILDGELSGGAARGRHEHPCHYQRGRESRKRGKLVFFLFDLLSWMVRDLTACRWIEAGAKGGSSCRDPEWRRRSASSTASIKIGATARISCRSVQARPRRDRLEACRPSVCCRETWVMGKDQMPEPRGICRRLGCDRLTRAAGIARARCLPRTYYTPDGQNWFYGGDGRGRGISDAKNRTAGNGSSRSPSRRCPSRPGGAPGYQRFRIALSFLSRVHGSTRSCRRVKFLR